MVESSGRVLAGAEAAAVLRAEVAGKVGALADAGTRVGLATLLVGDDPASEVYVRLKHRRAVEAGLRSFDHRLPATAEQREVEAMVNARLMLGSSPEEFVDRLRERIVAERDYFSP